MLESIETNAGTVIPGMTILIKVLNDPYDSNYPGKTGIVTFIDDMGHLHGTWGGLAIIPQEDIIEILK